MYFILFSIISKKVWRVKEKMNLIHIFVRSYIHKNPSCDRVKHIV